MFQSKWPFFHSESGTVSVPCSIPSCPFFTLGPAKHSSCNWTDTQKSGVELNYLQHAVSYKRMKHEVHQKRNLPNWFTALRALYRWGWEKNQLSRWMYSAETHHRVHTKVPRGKQAKVKTGSPVRRSITRYSTAWIDQRPLVPHFYINCDMEDALTLGSCS